MRPANGLSPRIRRWIRLFVCVFISNNETPAEQLPSTPHPSKGRGGRKAGAGCMGPGAGSETANNNKTTKYMKPHQPNTFISRAAAMLLTVIMAFAGAQTAGTEIVGEASGTCGDNLSWTLTENGEDAVTWSNGTSHTALTLTITGSGNMAEYTAHPTNPVGRGACANSKNCCQTKHNCSKVCTLVP